MKIDIHVHTKKTKQGDAPSRNITPERFSEIIQSTDVKVVAITNHNDFDLEQFNLMLAQVDGAVQIWPGIELDVLDDNKRSHLIVIVSPERRDRFHKKVVEATVGQTPDNFTISLEDTVSFFEELEPLYIAHYMGKKPDMSEESIERLLSLGVNPKRVIKEATSAISAGIFIAHGHASIYGSDIQDWDKYTDEAANLPELRLSVDSFEQFCLLLEKDVSAINTAINHKQSDELTLQPFEDDTKIFINSYSDINVLFGAKGTGKTKILEAIAKHYSNSGVNATVFESAPDKLGDRFDIKGKDIDKNFELKTVHDCKDEILFIKSAKEQDVTSLHEYRDYFRSERRNKNAGKMKIKDLSSMLLEAQQTKLKDYTDAHNKVQEMIGFLSSNTPVIEVSSEEERTNLVAHLSALATNLKRRSWEYYVDWKSSELTNSASKCFRDEVARKTGALSKPIDTGFKLFASNRLKIRRNAQEVCLNINKAIADEVEAVGTLGVNKGQLDCVTSFKLQDGTIHDSLYSPIKQIRKSDQKDFSRAIKDIEKQALSDNLFDSITQLNSIEDISKIVSMSDLLLFWRRFTLSGDDYSPSNGECSMLNLHSELADDKQVYLLDEPERSLGNQYINDIIIPLINEKARQGKKVFISTHDANIAVRTLPYNSIYRCHDKDGYATYSGNPFSNNLVCQVEQDKVLDWKKISMTTLEGGEVAFGERGKIYGNR
ncbi:hypothetical protein [Thalassotalea sp. ND16A]|uniref:hypothetical protein n=1 Tax=Thalassotalea sp. ND16A TaxID=1535422 RepID=UPI00051A6836|nr:hypothetical protein [Thalassotalea sp. ND16A]KGJ92081.1 hypothetical protein ND16A_1775 [Thalassotalea sp. ND16A]